MSNKITSSLDLVEDSLDRIKTIDRSGPTLRSVLEVNPDARRLAKQLDADRKRGDALGPLHGEPVLVKDNIATVDRMQTTAGSLALIGAKAPRDAHVVHRLRSAGALILGKANLSEWSNFRGANSSSGWSARGGQCRNAHVLDRTPSGSSSGSAAAVGAGLVRFAVGTETDGSIVSPASCNGIVGFKPTLGAVSRDGIIPIAASQDTAGPMTRSVEDAAWLLAGMVGADVHDAATKGQKLAAPDLIALAKALQAGTRSTALKGLRIGVARNLAGYHRGVDALFEQALKDLAKAGAVLVEASVPNADKLGPTEVEVLLYELKHGMAAYLREFAANLKFRSLDDLIAFNARTPKELAVFGQERFEKAAAKGALTDAAYRKALATNRRLSRTQGIDAALKKHDVALFVAPTTSPAALIDQVNGHRPSGSASSPAAVAGYPHLTVPMGAVDHLPVGLSFFGPAWSDLQVLAAGAAYEQRTGHLIKPRFLKTLPVKA